MRPGEKLFEELFFTGADVAPTDHPKILRARDAEATEHNPVDIQALIEAARENRSAGKIRRLILRLVPEYAGTQDTGEFAIGADDAAASQQWAEAIATPKSSPISAAATALLHEPVTVEEGPERPKLTGRTRSA